MEHHNNNSIIVFGINGTSADRYKVERLKWKYVSILGYLPSNCSVKSCNGKYGATAHVMLDDGRRSNNWFLVPQCKSCNHCSRNSQRMPLRANAALIELSAVRNVLPANATKARNKFK